MINCFLIDTTVKRVSLQVNDHFRHLDCANFVRLADFVSLLSIDKSLPRHQNIEVLELTYIMSYNCLQIVPSSTNTDTLYLFHTPEETENPVGLH